MDQFNNMLINLFLVGLIGSSATSQSNRCTVSSSATITAVDCNNMELNGQELPLDSKIPSTSVLVLLNLSNCTGWIDETSFNNINHLQSINLDSCAMDKFTIPDLTELKDLDIRNSRIPPIRRDSLKNAKNLKHLAFLANKMEIESGSFKDLSFLTSLDIEQQNVTLDTQFLKGLKRLVLLSLSDTTIRKIPRDAFKEVPELRDLNLDRNPLQTIENGALDSLKKLTNLNILENQMEKLDVELLKELRNLNSLRAPASTLRNFNLKKFLDYCPNFNNFDFSLADCGSPQLNNLKTQVVQLKAYYVFIYFDGVARPDRC